LEKAAHVVFASVQEGALVALEDCRELAEVTGVGGHGEGSESFFDFEIVAEGGDNAKIGLRKHKISMRVIGRCGK
jgi:hypothetical protein